MQVSPRYEGPAVISMGRTVADPGLAVTRQRRRMEQLLAGLTAEQWAAPSRCDGWAVRDVIAHLVTVNRFWESSVRAGAAGEPTRILANFDPAAHPPMLIASMTDLGPDEMLAQFIVSNDGFLGAVAELTAEQWALPAESPAGHVPITHVVDHGVWDSWIHERDICLPLGLTQELEDDEIQVTLRYAAAIGPGIGVIRTDAFRGSLAVEATDPEARFVLEVTESVAVREGEGDPSMPCLRGDAVELIEGLSLRGPMPADAPAEWNQVIQGLVDAFTIV